jgi:hypothetical protein
MKASRDHVIRTSQSANGRLTASRLINIDLHWMTEKPKHLLIFNVFHLTFQLNSTGDSHAKWQTILHQENDVSSVGEQLE